MARSLLQYYCDGYGNQYCDGYNWSGGRIVGIVIAAVCFAVAFAILIYSCCLVRRRRRAYAAWHAYAAQPAGGLPAIPHTIGTFQPSQLAELSSLLQANQVQQQHQQPGYPTQQAYPYPAQQGYPAQNSYMPDNHQPRGEQYAGQNQWDNKYPGGTNTGTSSSSAPVQGYPPAQGTVTGYPPDMPPTFWGHVRQDFSHPFGSRRQDNNGNSNVQMGHVPPTQTQATI